MAADVGVFSRLKSFADYQDEAGQKGLAQALQLAQIQKAMQPDELSIKDLIGFQLQQQNNLANQELRRESFDEKKAIKAEKIQAVQDVKNKGKQDFEDGLANLAARYKKLKELGGITSVNDGSLSNFGAGISSSGIGQAVGGLFGTKEQSERNSIAGEVPLLTQAIKSATGMSAQQMNSNVELQTFLKALGDPKNDYEANVDILGNLSKRFGTGEVARSIGNGAKPASPAAAREQFNAKKAAPSGGQLIGTSGGKKVFQLPDGTHVMEQ